MYKTFQKSDLKNKIAVLVGTRPGIIKMSPLVQELIERNHDMTLIHAGQHYSNEMDKKIFEDIGLPSPNYRILGMDELTLHGEQTAEMLKGIEKSLIKDRPRCLLVCGDANTNLAGALAARKLNIEIGHVEAGLRSHDWRMPEEHNRILIDHISEYLFAPTEESVKNLKKENVRGSIQMVGNTIVDATMRNVKISQSKSKILINNFLKERQYILLTTHREENVDNPKVLSTLFSTIKEVISLTGHRVIFPVHPRTKKNMVYCELYSTFSSLPMLTLIEPQGYLDFLHLLNNAKLVMTDSGGIQEEACILGVPCVTLRDNTERPESVKVGANIITGINPKAVCKAVSYWYERDDCNWSNPYGDGKASKRIIDTVLTKTKNL